MADTPEPIVPGAAGGPGAAEGEGQLISALRRLPLFPLPNAVLFPHALLPLHIFEERYRVMVRDVLTGTRCLAVGLLVPDAREEDELPAVEPIAGVGEVVMAHELPDGRFNLVVRGPRARPHRSRAPLGAPLSPGDGDRAPRPSDHRPSEIVDADQTLRALIGVSPTPSPKGASCSAR